MSRFCLSCPMCGTLDNSDYYRTPSVVDDVIVRRRLCLTCRHIFSTAEVVITNSLAERVLAALTPTVVLE